MCELQILFTVPREHVLLMLEFPRAHFSSCASLGELPFRRIRAASYSSYANEVGRKDHARVRILREHFSLDDEYLAMALRRINWKGDGRSGSRRRAVIMLRWRINTRI